MLLFTDSYGEPCVINPDYVALAYKARGAHETTVLMTTGEQIVIQESPEDMHAAVEGYVAVYAEEDNCETCLYEDDTSPEAPCPFCRQMDPDQQDSHWEPKEDDDSDDDTTAVPGDDVGEVDPKVHVSGVPYAVSLRDIKGVCGND